MSKILFIILIISVLLSACANPAQNKIKAETTQASSQNAAKQSKGENVAFSEDNSKLEFTGSKVTGKQDGGFKKFAGAIDLVNNKPEDSQVSVDIEMISVFTDASGLSKHLQTPDFFDVEKFPKASFISTKIVPDKEKGANNFLVTGDLDFHGTKKSITYPATITVDSNEVGVKSEFFINRKDFGVVYAGKADDLIRDEVVLRLDIHAPRKK